MLTTEKTLKGYSLQSLDGKIGTAKEFYFDDRYWTIRYLIADAGSWLMGWKVLISPYALIGVNKEEETISIDLTKKQIEDCPSLSSDKPVSKQYEEAYYQYYGWPLYWGGPYTWGYSSRIEKDRKNWDTISCEKDTWDPNLRSTHDMMGHKIHALDGEIGTVEDFIIDEDTWIIRYMVVNTGNWLSGKKVIISPRWIERISWDELKVFVSLSCEVIKQSQEYKEPLQLTREYETGLYQHYNRPGYWVDETDETRHTHQ